MGTSTQRVARLQVLSAVALALAVLWVVTLRTHSSALKKEAVNLSGTVVRPRRHEMCIMKSSIMRLFSREGGHCGRNSSTHWRIFFFLKVSGEGVTL